MERRKMEQKQKKQKENVQNTLRKPYNTTHDIVHAQCSLSSSETAMKRKNAKSYLKKCSVTSVSQQVLLASPLQI